MTASRALSQLDDMCHGNGTYRRGGLHMGKQVFKRLRHLPSLSANIG